MPHPLTLRLRNWFLKSLSSRHAHTMSSVHSRLSKKPGSLEWRWWLFWLEIGNKGSKYFHSGVEQVV